jgi:electron transport complex protein RnfB
MGMDHINGTHNYAKLAGRFNAPDSGRFIKILEAMYTPEEAELALELPATDQQLAIKFNVDQNILHDKLESMVKRGLILWGKEGYVTHKNITSFHHAALGLVPQNIRVKIYPLWKDFFYADWRAILVANWEERLKARGYPSHKVVPARKALALSPGVNPDDILWYENTPAILKKAKKIIAGACGCRVAWGQCQSPLDVCLSVDYEGTHRKRPSQKELSFDEALAVMDMVEETGRVHISVNTGLTDHYCNCCDDCCVVLNSQIHYKKVQKLLSPSRYRAVIDESKCGGCQTCVERCKFDAIEMRKPANSKKMKACIINENCMGCGLCVFKCPQKALTLELVRPPEHIPYVPKTDVSITRRGFEWTAQGLK